MLFTQLIILLTVTSQALSVTISDLNNIASNQVTKRLGGGSRGSSSSGSRGGSSSGSSSGFSSGSSSGSRGGSSSGSSSSGSEVVARVAVVHPVVEIGK